MLDSSERTLIANRCFQIGPNPWIESLSPLRPICHKAEGVSFSLKKKILWESACPSGCWSWKPARLRATLALIWAHLAFRVDSWALGSWVPQTTFRQFAAFLSSSPFRERQNLTFLRLRKRNVVAYLKIKNITVYNYLVRHKNAGYILY